MPPLDDLKAAIENASLDLAGNGRRATPSFERPPRPEFGDYSTNAAMLLAGALKAKPRDIAGQLGEKLQARLGDRLVRVDVAGPGFLNLFLADAWYADTLAAILADQSYGAVPAAQPRRINVEFVSANPTGPLTAAGGRHAAFGDALARLLELRGHAVVREYYVNDFGGQIRKLGESIRARALGEEVPEGGYQGDYVAALARAVPDVETRPVEEIADAGVRLLLEHIKASLQAFRVEYDLWASERALHEAGKVDAALEELRERGHLYESEGALWARTTTLGDDKDRVLRKSDGDTTYFASDIAYHLDKRARGAELMINLLGSDHHGYAGRMKAFFQAFGLHPDDLEILMMQFVHIVESGAQKQMSKRRGDFVTLDELIERIGVDAARFFMLQRSHDTTIDLDIDLATSSTKDNPVYYVQYAHARIASLRRKAAAEAGGTGESALLPAEIVLEAHEKALIKFLAAFPGECVAAADRRAPHIIATYALELARQFTAFYENCPVLKAPSDDQRAFRLALSAATQQVLARALGVLGVTAPDSM